MYIYYDAEKTEAFAHIIELNCRKNTRPGKDDDHIKNSEDR